MLPVPTDKTTSKKLTSVAPETIASVDLEIGNAVLAFQIMLDLTLYFISAPADQLRFSPFQPLGGQEPDVLRDTTTTGILAVESATPAVGTEATVALRRKPVGVEHSQPTDVRKSPRAIRRSLLSTGTARPAAEVMRPPPSDLRKLARGSSTSELALLMAQLPLKEKRMPAVKTTRTSAVKRVEIPSSPLKNTQPSAVKRVVIPSSLHQKKQQLAVKRVVNPSSKSTTHTSVVKATPPSKIPVTRAFKKALPVVIAPPQLESNKVPEAVPLTTHEGSTPQDEKYIRKLLRYMVLQAVALHDLNVSDDEE